MFDMGLWDEYLAEYCHNAEKAGATPVDVLELLYLKQGQLLAKIKAQEELFDD